jgi:hypothetical protein
MYTMSRLIKLFILSVVLISICYGLFVVIRRPSNDRNWNTDQATLPTITIDGDMVNIQNIRNFTYRSTTDYTPSYYDATYNISDITRVWFAVEPFLQTKIGAAHTLVSFEFSDGRYLAISVEIRKEAGESFSPLKGMLRNYELMYVIADERDVLGLRAIHRKDDVFLYPVKTTPEHAQQLFVSMLTYAQQLEQHPEMYHTVTNNCTTNLAGHVNKLFPNRIPWSFSFLLPAHADETLLSLRLIDDVGTIEELRAKYHINKRAEQYQNDPVFSQHIRL